ncbi:MAG: patatin-like phospholipase family protein [Proteobacteria bacterium]|nr:MAG: patatin-like phospholipase family protein [Pseudomonadota bacterium]
MAYVRLISIYRHFSKTLAAALVCVAVATTLLNSPTALAQQTCAEPATPVALTLSGGVSLGAYQSGSLAYASLVLKQNPALLQTRLMTGASAGALNAFLSVISICGLENRLPSESDFYKTWVGFKGEELLASKSETKGLFSRRAFDTIVERLHAKWKLGLPKSCDVVLGLSVTRVTPLKDISQLGYSRQSEKITVRIRGRGEGASPLITNYVNPTLSPRPILLALKPGDDDQNFQALKDVLFASAAFPVAFAPQKIKTCVSGPTDRWRHADLPFTCQDDEAEEADFVDGGIFDNKPLALGERIARTGLERGLCSEAAWREIPSALKKENASSQLLYIYSDLGSTSYPLFSASLHLLRSWFDVVSKRLRPRNNRNRRDHRGREEENFGCGEYHFESTWKLLQHVSQQRFGFAVRTDS